MNENGRSHNWQKEKILKSKKHQYKAAQDINGLIVKYRQGRNIELQDGKKLNDFTSCSYLGLDQDMRVINSTMNSMRTGGINFAVSRTRMRMENFVTLEALLGKILCASHVTLFSSLHLAHLGMMPLIASGEMPSFPIKNKPLFVLDKTVHASLQILRGILNQFGEVKFADFQLPEEIEKHFQYADEHDLTPIAISDGIGSMGGVCPISKLFALAEKYDGYVYLDDAHGTSICGKYGCGYVLEQLNCEFHPRLILAASLSKGFGTSGGVIAVPTKEDEEIIKRFCNAYVFSNPLALPLVDAAIAAAEIHLSDELEKLQSKLKSNIDYFDSLMEDDFHDKIINYRIPIPIRCIRIGDEYKAIELSAFLKEKGFIALAATYPTVAKGNSLLRVAIAADHTQTQISELCKNIISFINDTPS